VSLSLRTRLLVAVGAVSLIALVVADIVTYQELRSFLYRGVDQSLAVAHLPFERDLGSIGPAPRGQGGSQGGVPGENPGAGAVPAGPLNQPQGEFPSCETFSNVGGLDPGTYVEVRRAGGSVVEDCASRSLPGISVSTPALPKKITGFSTNNAEFGEQTAYLTVANKSGPSTPFRVRASILRGGPYTGGLLIVAVPVGQTVSTLNHLRNVELLVTAVALVAAALLGWWLVRVGMRPLRAVERTAEAIAAGELEQRVPGDAAKTEVGRLARALNVMLGKIEKAFAQRDETEAELRASESRMRQFVADASHELRTPLAAVSAYAELFERGASTRPADLARVMQGIKSETSRMGHLVDDLLLLARLDEGRPLDRQDVEIVELAAEAVRTAVTVGGQWPVRLEASHPVEVVGDRVRLRQVIDNLLSNVRAHTPPGMSAVVGVEQSDHEAIITVSDSGPGLSDDQAARVFERFYRADASRSRAHGGAGLGLSIVASIVRAHGGRVEVSPRSGGGSVFTVHLPIAPSTEPPDPESPDPESPDPESPDPESPVGTDSPAGPESPVGPERFTANT